jgi:hypothetical protein
MTDNPETDPEINLPAGRQVQDEGNKKQGGRSKKQVKKCKAALSLRTPVRNRFDVALAPKPDPENDPGISFGTQAIQSESKKVFTPAPKSASNTVRSRF